MTAAIYARVSTVDQNNAIQVRELTEYVERRGWELAEVYQDQMSGAKASRPGLDQFDGGCPSPEIRRRGRLEA